MEAKDSSSKKVKTECCPECGSLNLRHDHESSELVCMDCGLVIAAKMVDRGPEWKAYDLEQRLERSRAGPPLTYTIHDKGLSTAIDNHDRDVYGRSLSPGQKIQAYRLRKWQTRIRISDATERNLSIALSLVSKISDSLTLPKNVSETASIIYRRAVKKRLVRGRTIEGVTAAAIYLACRQCGLARTLDEVAQASSIDKKEVGRNYRFLVNKLEYFVPPPKASPYVTKLSNQLSVYGKAEEITHKILSAAKEIKLTAGRSPIGVVAAASYIASVLTGERKTQKELAESSQITEVTIRNRYKELVERLMFVITL